MNCSFFWRVKWLGRRMCCFSENHGGVNLLNGENCCCSRINPFQQHLLILAEIFNKPAFAKYFLTNIKLR